MMLLMIKFCPKCKSIMIPRKGILRCRKCGYEEEGEGISFISKKDMKEKEIAVVEEEGAGLPTTKAYCPECGNDVAYWWMRQLRAADESEVRFFRCTKCGYTWREYD
jgi:DNA-directed RNA polymerase subunit M